MNADLRALIEDRLKSDGFRQRDWAAAVVAACDGRDALEQVVAALPDKRLFSCQIQNGVIPRRAPLHAAPTII